MTKEERTAMRNLLHASQSLLFYAKNSWKKESVEYGRTDWYLVHIKSTENAAQKCREILKGLEE